MRGFWSVLALAAIFMFVPIARSDEPKPEPPKSPAATEAMAKADADIQDADKAYLATVARIRKTELSELKRAETIVLKNADLDEGNRINIVIKQIEASEPKLPTTDQPKDAQAVLAAGIASTKWQAVGHDWNFYFGADGKVANMGHISGVWTTFTDHSAIMIQEDGNIDVWRFDESFSVARIQNAKFGGGGIGPWDAKRIE